MDDMDKFMKILSLLDRVKSTLDAQQECLAGLNQAIEILDKRIKFLEEKAHA